MNKIQIESYLLVTVQFLCAVFFFYFALSTPFGLLSIILVTGAIAIALWSVFTMHFGNLRLQPIPKDDAKLITGGPYRFIRHPMYTAVLLGMLGIAINIDLVLGYGVWIVLCIDLYVKLHFEEKLLLEKFSEYKEYMRRTKRLLPFLW
jgi:protein-S-isoprenylcysteine O-methyltransferase Ste14